VEIKNQIRALQPWPRAFTDWQRPQATPLRLILHRATVLDANSEAPPGTVTEADQMLHVATGGGTLQLDELQPAGKRAMQAADFLRGYPIAAGNLLG
jgi:methionyl-tRNA formyltransferase